nr:ATP-dependent helicase HrpB [Gammaproteobacteria bacterium]
ELLNADLTALALELALWGVDGPEQLAWMDLPPSGAFAQARGLLCTLGALDSSFRITERGRRIATLGSHPRLANMLVWAKDNGCLPLAAQLAAMLEEGDPLPDDFCDFELRLDALRRHFRRESVPGLRRDVAERIRRTAQVLSGVGRRARATEVEDVDAGVVGELLLRAYPDRIARKRAPESMNYRLSNGRGLTVAPGDSIGRAEFLVVPALDAGERNARPYLAAATDIDTIRAVHRTSICEADVVQWDVASETVRAERVMRLGELELASSPSPAPPVGEVVRAMVHGLRRLGLGALPWNATVNAWRARVSSMRYWQSTEDWPDLSDEFLLGTLEEWLGPYLDGVTRRSHLSRLDLQAILSGLMPWSQQAVLNKQAPTHWVVPSGSRIPLEYDPGSPPLLSVRIQELFGLLQTPRICFDTVPIRFALLSPARRPVQVTQDLESFWSEGYPQVRKELRGRYQKHYWPEDPFTAVATGKTKRNMGR